MMESRTFHMLRGFALLFTGVIESTACSDKAERGVARNVDFHNRGERISISVSSTVCPDCIEMSRMATLGDNSTEEFIENAREILRDTGHRYWVAQRSGIKVFDSTGHFLRIVGRAGGGPMEFRGGIPRYVDDSGYVHVVDPGNGRITTVDTMFRLVSETSVAGIDLGSLFHMPRSDRWLANAWVTTAEGVAHPLHLINGSQVERSFGSDESQSAQNPFSIRRIVTFDNAQRIFAAKRFSYEIEVYSDSAELLATLSGPRLNDSPVQWAAYNLRDNPLPNELLAIRVDDKQRLWLLTRRVSPHWREAFREVVHPNGMVGMVLKSGRSYDEVMTDVIEVVDLPARTIVAQQKMKGLFLSFFDKDLILEIPAPSDDRQETVVWQLKLK